MKEGSLSFIFARPRSCTMRNPSMSAISESLPMTTTLRFSALALLFAGAVSNALAATIPPDELVRSTAEDVRKELQARSAEFTKDPDSLERLVEKRVVP